MTHNNLCSTCKNIGCEFQSGIVRTKCAFYMPPQEPCTDAVSRQKVLDAIRLISLGQTDVVKVSMMTEDYVKKLPSVTQKSGKWLMTGEVDVYYDLPSYECSKCGQPSLENGDFCPNCGCRMVEPQERSDKE